MGASVIVPVWNGASVVVQCLDAVFRNSGPQLQQVICVDNASSDGSADLIATHFPQVQWVKHAANLGFGGGVNAGMHVATGDVLVLLNQDCLPQPGWLDPLLHALRTYPAAGIAGCTLFAADGKIDHAGARMTRPLALGEHLTQTGGAVRPMDYVTGAIFAISRAAYNATGDFDEGFFPAYYEESDYCYRARAHGFESIYVPEAAGQHVRSSREWQRDTVLHTANQHRSRYRFVLKHFDERELQAFFAAECAATRDESHYDQALGRALAARAVLRLVDEIAVRRQLDLHIEPSPVRQRASKDELARVKTAAIARAQVIAQCDDATLDQLQAHIQSLHRQISFRDDANAAAAPSSATTHIKRLRGLINGRDWALQAQLHEAQAAQMETLRRRARLFETLIAYDHL